MTSRFELPFTRKKRTLEEIQTDNERLSQESENEELQLSIAQKQALRRKLEQSGLTVNKDFGGSLTRAWRWLNKQS